MKNYYDILGVSEDASNEQIKKAFKDIAKKVIDSNPDQVSAYKAGKDKLFGFFVGQIMKETQGKANPKAGNEILKDLLK